jgi:hypothetical protein
MVNYCTLEEVKAYLKMNTSDTGSDVLLNMYIEDSSRQIENECSRQFYASYETRSFDAVYPTVDKNTLFVDMDLLGVTTLTNGNGTAIAASAYVLEPANYSPKYAITLKQSTSIPLWQYNEDYNQAISVNGTWGYNLGTTPPSPVRLACIRLSLWRFKQPEAPFNTSSFPEIGAVVTPSAMPEDVLTLLAPYKRLISTAIQKRQAGVWGY